MGIAFTDLSPRMVAELRGVVDESEEKAQVVNLRFAGKSQLLATRALPTAEGFQFTTALPFLRTDTEVEISLSPDATLATKGWVSSVALDRAGEDGVPRLVIDIRAGESAAPRLAPDAAVSGQLESPQAPAPSTEVGAVPEQVWQPWEVSPSLDDAGGFSPDAESDPLESAADGATPSVGRDPDKTEVVRFSDLAPPSDRCDDRCRRAQPDARGRRRFDCRGRGCCRGLGAGPGRCASPRPLRSRPPSP